MCLECVISELYDIAENFGIFPRHIHYLMYEAEIVGVLLEY
jgi:hypothetical protein